MENGLNLPKHMAEHVYMFSGESRPIVLQTNRGMAGELIDWFGKSVRFEEGEGDTIRAHVTVNLVAMRYWALQYAPFVIVLSPQSLVEQVKADLKNATERYGGATNEK